MPSGFRVDIDNWLQEYDKAKELAQEIVQLIQERNLNHSAGGAEASRKTATARRKIGTLGTTVESLLKWLDSQEASGLSDQEKHRRRESVLDLKNRREQMQVALKRNQGQSDREVLMEGSSSRIEPRETERTAELDSRGLLQLQQQTMDNQDQMLTQMEKTVTSTKHIALAIGEEVDLQTRLLDDVQDDVDVTHMRMRAATARIKNIMNNSSHWKGGLCIFLLIVTLVTLLIIFLKLHKLFSG